MLTAMAGLLLAGCGDDSDAIVISGSSTVEPISIAVAEKFDTRHPDVNLFIDGPGTGDGFELFCQGETDINDASSKIKAEQIEACEENGIEFVELRIGNDGITMLTSTANEGVSCLNFADLYALTGPESQGVKSWDAAAPLAKELGSGTELPSAPLQVIGPGEESGTFVSYVELAVEDLAEERGVDPTTRPDYQASGDDNVILQGVQGSKTSLGWVGFAFARDRSDVKILAVSEAPGEPCVAPTDETIADNSYPISRPLFIYVNVEHAATNPALTDFVDFYLSDEGIASVSEVGYVKPSPEALADVRARWDQRTTGAATP